VLYSFQVQGFSLKVSPPFKGGVAGITVLEMFTILLSRSGWLKTDSAEIELFLRYVLNVKAFPVEKVSVP